MLDVSQFMSHYGWGWQGPLGPSGPILAQAETSTAECPGPYPGGFWRSSKRRANSLSGYSNLSGQPVSVLCYLHSTGELPDVQGESPGLQFVPVRLVLALGTSEKSHALSSLYLPFWALLRSPRAYSPGWTVPTLAFLVADVFQSHCFHGHLLDLLQ